MELVASEASALHPLLEQNLPELTKVLLANLVYSSADMMAMDAGSLDNDNADRPDSLEEIQPQFHKEGGFSDMDKAERAAAGSTFLSEEWTARRAAADALDALAGYAGTHPQVCSRMLPMIFKEASVHLLETTRGWHPCPRLHRCQLHSGDARAPGWHDTAPPLKAYGRAAPSAQCRLSELDPVSARRHHVG